MAATAAGWVAAETAIADGSPYRNSAQQVHDANGATETFLLFQEGNCPSGTGYLDHAWTGGPGWTPLGGQCFKSFNVGTNQDGRLEAFAVGYGGAMWHDWQTAPSTGPWSGWNSLGEANGAFADGPYVVSALSGQPEIRVKGDDGAGVWWMRHQTSPNCCWSAWGQL